MKRLDECGGFGYKNAFCKTLYFTYAARFGISLVECIEAGLLINIENTSTPHRPLGTDSTAHGRGVFVFWYGNNGFFGELEYYASSQENQ